MVRFPKRLSLFVLAFTLGACSSSSGSLPLHTTGGAPSGDGGTGAPSNGQVRVTASLSRDGLPQFAAISRRGATSRRRALSTSFQSLVFSGTIYPGYAGNAAQTAVSTLNATSVPPTVGLTFSSVPPGNNEWVVISVTAYTGPNASGSSTPIGQLGGLFNVGSTASVTVDNGSTERLQLALAGMVDGMISTYELMNQTSLDSDLGNFIGSSGASTDPNTALFSDGTLALLLDNLLSSYSRALTISGNVAAPSTAWVTWDYTNASEVNYSASVAKTANSLSPLDSTVIRFPQIFGSPNAGLLASLGTATGPSAPSAPGAPLPRSIVSDGFDANAGSAKISGVYGGALLVGVGTNAFPYQPLQFAGEGGFASVAGRARNSAPTASVSESTTYVTLTQNDPEGFLLSDEAYTSSAFAVTLAPIDDAYGFECHAALCRGTSQLVVSRVSVGSTGSSVGYYADQFNPWALSSGKFAFCVHVSAECFPLSDSSVSTHTPFFADTQTGGAWQIQVPSSGAGATTSVGIGDPDSISYTSSSAPASGYVDFDLAPDGGSLPVYFFGGQEVDITTTAPVGSKIYFNIGCGGTVYQYTSLVTGGIAKITIASFTGLITCQSVQVGYTLNSTSTSGTFDIGPFLPPGGS